MTKTKNIYLVLLAVLLSPMAANATAIDFTTMANGPITTIGDATFSLAGDGVAGDPYNLTGRGLTNSTTGSYPTNTIMRVDFASLISSLVFDFNPQGLNGYPGQGWAIFDGGISLIASGSYSSGSSASYDLSAYSGISRIEFYNGIPAADRNWISDLERISYDAISVPEPGTLALLGLGLAGMGMTRRKKKV